MQLFHILISEYRMDKMKVVLSFLKSIFTMIISIISVYVLLEYFGLTSFSVLAPTFFGGMLFVYLLSMGMVGRLMYGKNIQLLEGPASGYSQFVLKKDRQLLRGIFGISTAKIDSGEKLYRAQVYKGHWIIFLKSSLSGLMQAILVSAILYVFIRVVNQGSLELWLGACGIALLYFDIGLLSTFQLLGVSEEGEL